MSETTLEGLEKELGKAQIILAYVLQEVGDVSIPLGRKLEDGIAIEVIEGDENMTVRLVRE